MKKIGIIIISLLLTLVSCAQSKKDNSTTTIETKETSKFMYKTQNFDSEPIYNLKIRTIYSYKILINDIPVVSRHNTATGTIWYPINNSLLQKKDQSLSIIIYPIYISNSSQNETLENDIEFKLEIEESFWTDDDMSEPVSILKFELPKQDKSGQEINYSNLKFYTQTLSFQAKVPYKITEWHDSYIFKEKDSSKITARVLSFYNDLKKNYENQEGENYANSIKKGIYNSFKANYFTGEEAIKRFQGKIDFINKKKRELAPIENFRLDISGGGRVVSLKRIDGFNKEEGVLRRYYTKNGIQKVQIEDILLHIPKDKNEIEVLWYYNIVRPANISK